MKIYKQNPLDTDLGPLSGIIKPILVVLVLVLVVVIISTQTSNVLHAQLAQNPLFLSKNDSTIMNVLVTNPENAAVNNVIVSLRALGSTQLSLYPAQQAIQTLGPQETRKLEFLVSPLNADSSPFLPGTYRIDISTQISGKNYSTNVFVNVEK